MFLLLCRTPPACAPFSQYSLPRQPPHIPYQNCHHHHLIPHAYPRRIHSRLLTKQSELQVWKASFASSLWFIRLVLTEKEAQKNYSSLFSSILCRFLDRRTVAACEFFRPRHHHHLHFLYVRALLTRSTLLTSSYPQSVRQAVRQPASHIGPTLLHFFFTSQHCACCQRRIMFETLCSCDVLIPCPPPPFTEKCSNVASIYARGRRRRQCYFSKQEQRQQQ